MDQDDGSAGQTPGDTPDKKLGWPKRLRSLRNGPRAAWHQFHWRAEDTLALVVTAAIVLLIFLVLLRP